MLLYFMYRALQLLVSILPLKASYWLGTKLADIHFSTSKKDRELVISNMEAVLGKDPVKAREAARWVFWNFAKYLVEFLRFKKMGREYIEKHVKIEGLDNLKRSVDSGKGTIVFSAHMGNWEWAAAIVSQLGFSLNVVALAHKDKMVNKFFINQRSIKGVKSVPLGGSVRKTLELFSRNELVALLIDRDFSNNSLPVDFFGRTAFMPAGIGILARKSGCRVQPCFIIREKDDTHKIIFDSPIEYTITEDKKEDIKKILQKATKIVERYVRLYPEQWFMFDDPWKDRSKS